MVVVGGWLYIVRFATPPEQDILGDAFEDVFFETRHFDMQKLGSSFIVRRSYYHRSKALDEIFSMARSMGLQEAKIT